MFISLDGEVTVLSGTDGAAVKGLPELPRDTPAHIAGAFPFTAVEQRGRLLLLRDGSAAGVARFVGEFARRGGAVTVRHTFGPVCSATAPVPEPRRGAQHTF